jgi:hypothetical protein
VAITGSAGKTTTKEVTAEFLATKYRVIRNRGNFNNHIGLPLSLMELRQRPEIAVVELGMNHAGEISTLVGVSEPDVRVWTNVGEAHRKADSNAIADEGRDFEAQPRQVCSSRTRHASDRGAHTGLRDGQPCGSIVPRRQGGVCAAEAWRMGASRRSWTLSDDGHRPETTCPAATRFRVRRSAGHDCRRRPPPAPAAHRGSAGRSVRYDDSHNANPTAKAGA